MGLLDQSIISTVTGYAAATAVKAAPDLIASGVQKTADVFGVKNPFAKVIAQGDKVTPTATSTPVSAEQLNVLTTRTDSEDVSHMVKLYVTQNPIQTTAFYNDQASTNILGPYSSNQIIFKVQPQVQEHRSATYEAVNISQMPGQFQKYKGNPSVSWNITAELVSRNTQEATENFINLMNLRAWLMPAFGRKQGIALNASLGAPPPIVWFSGWRGLVGPVPTVLTDVSHTLGSDDCDWIPTDIIADDITQSPDSWFLNGKGMYEAYTRELDAYKTKGNKVIPFPVVMQVSISLLETFSIAQFNGFDLQAFHEGRMVSAWTPYREGDKLVSEPQVQK